MALIGLGELEAANTVLLDGLRAAEDAEDSPFISSVLAELGILAAKRGQWDEANRCVERSLAVVSMANLGLHGTSSLTSRWRRV